MLKPIVALLLGAFIFSSCSNDENLTEMPELRSAVETTDTVLPNKYVGLWRYESNFYGMTNTYCFEFTKYGTYSEFSLEKDENGRERIAGNYNFLNNKVPVEFILEKMPIKKKEISIPSTGGIVEVYKKDTTTIDNSFLIGKWKLISRGNTPATVEQYLEISDTKVSEYTINTKGKIVYTYKNSNYKLGFSYIHINKAEEPLKNYFASQQGKLSLFRPNSYNQVTVLDHYELITE